MFKKITLLASLLMATFSFSQTVSTVTEGNFYDSIDRDSQGNIYCSDFPNGDVYKYDSTGNVTTFKSGLTNPNGISVNGQDEIFVCDAAANTVYRYDTNGTELSAYTTNINNPTGIRNIPGTTDMLIVEYNNNTLKQLALDGTVTTLFSGFPLNGPSGIAFINGETYVSNFNDRKIMRFENNMMTMITQLPADGPNNNFLGFLSASNSQLFATQWGAHKIYSIDPATGNASVYAGSSLGNDDGDISVATFNFPNGILVDEANDRIYVSEVGTSNLRIIDNATLSTTDFNQISQSFIASVDRQTDSLVVSANLSSTEKITIRVFEIIGKEVMKKEFSVTENNFEANITLADLSSGTYVVLFAQGGLLLTKKIII